MAVQAGLGICCLHTKSCFLAKAHRCSHKLMQTVTCYWVKVNVLIF